MKKGKENIYMAMRRPCLAASAFGIYEVLRLPHSEIYMLDKINGLVLSLSFFSPAFLFLFLSSSLYGECQASCMLKIEVVKKKL